MRKHEEVRLFLLATVGLKEKTIIQTPEYSVSGSKEKNYNWQNFVYHFELNPFLFVSIFLNV